MLFWYLLALTIILLWTGLMMAVYYSKWKDPIEQKGFMFAGPFLLWKTLKGKRIIERVAKRERLVEFYGKVTVWVTGVAMIVMTIFLFWSAFLVIRIARSHLLEPHMLLGLPGINPLIPLWYSIFALVIAMIVHEFSHGILSALAKVKIKSLGLLFFVLPMGAFVEPDEDELKKLEKKKRVRMYASGPASNIIAAFLCSVIFSVVLMGCVQPVTQGAGITDVGPGTAADIAGLEKGMILVSFDGNDIDTNQEFSYFIRNTEANQTVMMGVYDPDMPGETRSYNATLTDKALTTERNEDAGKGYLGVNTITVSTAHFHPIGGADELGGYAKSISMYVVLPLQGLSPVQEPFTDFYEITGFWSFLPDDVFWTIANAFYWLFWINLMLGLTNALPAVPLDGGYMFKDWLDSILRKQRSKKNKMTIKRLKRSIQRSIDTEGMSQTEAREKYHRSLERIDKKEEITRTKIVDRVAVALALTVLFLILWQVIGPRVLNVV